jgi:xanthine dehydrogenase accessory factor
MGEIYRNLISKLKKGKPLALTTIIETRGSSPQVPGASAIFSLQGLVEGTVGGGLLEANTHRRAIRAIREQRSLLLPVSMTGEDVLSAEEAICGGEATVLIDVDPKKHQDAFLSLEKNLKQRIPGVLATSVEVLNDEEILISRRWVEKNRIYGEDKEKLEPDLYESLKESFSTGKSYLLKSPAKASGRNGQENLLFLEPVFPPTHLVIAGAGHIGQALSHLGSLLDFEVSVIDDRDEYANSKNLPEADNIIVDDIGKAIRDIPLSKDAYVVIVTRGHSHDAEALRACITSEPAYIGMIGSAHKIAIMREKFLDEGWASASQWDRIHAPIGLAIQSKTVQEIAVSIAGELVLVRNKIQNQLRGAT